MARPDHKANAQAFLDRILTKLPADQRDTVQSALLADGVVEEVSQGVMLRAESSRVMNEAQRLQQHAAQVVQQNQEWYRTNENAIHSAVRVLERAGLDPNNINEDDLDERLTRAGRVQPQPQPGIRGAGSPDLVTREEHNAALNRAIAEITGTGAKYFSTLSKLQGQHIKEFNEALDTDEVLAIANENGLTLPLAYDAMVKDRRQAREQEARQKELAEAEARGRQLALTELGQDHPLPPRPGAGSAALARLGNGEAQDGFSVAAAAQELAQLVASQNTGST